MAKKILIVVGGGTKHLKPFGEEGKQMGLEVTVASFSDLEYQTKGELELKVKGERVENFAVIYIRLTGKRLEEASLLVDYAREKGITIVDRIYEEGRFIRIPLAKSLETKLLKDSGVALPKTYFGRLSDIAAKAPQLFGFPFVIKETSGKQGHGVWSPRNKEELEELTGKLRKREKEGKRFLSQEFIAASQRNRVFVIGGKAIAAITRPTRWRRRFSKNEVKREALMPVPEGDAQLAIAAAKALNIDIAGVDIIHEDATGKTYVLEVNSAPRWESIAKDTGVNVEREILRFLASRG